MHTDPIMFWQAVILLAVLAGSIIYNVMRPAMKK